MSLQRPLVLPPLSVGKMTLRLYGALNYSHGLSKGPSFGTGWGLEQAFNSLDAAAGDLHHVFREPESGGRGIAAAIAAGPRSRAPKSRCIRARIPVLASLPLVPRNQDIEHRRETSHRKPCGVIRAPRRPLTLDEQPELLPKEKIHCGEGAARAAQGCERMRQRPGQ